MLGAGPTGTALGNDQETGVKHHSPNIVHPEVVVIVDPNFRFHRRFGD
jgi:hypothetical protein